MVPAFVIAPPAAIATVEPDGIVNVFAVNWKSSALLILISIWLFVSAVILVVPPASNINSSPSKSKAPPSSVNLFEACVNVTSPLLKLITAPDELSNKSSPTVRSVPTERSASNWTLPASTHRA